MGSSSPLDYVLLHLHTLWSSPFLSTLGVLRIIITVVLVTSSIFLFLRQLFSPPHMSRRQANGKPFVMPSEPAGLPIFGHMFDLKNNLLESLSRWPKETGEFTTLHLGSTTWVLLNSSRVCQEILNKRGSLTNDRPYLPICQNVMSKNMRSVLMQQSPLYREERRVYHQLLTGSAITKYGISQDLESTQLLAEHMLKPNDWYLNHGRYANSVINLIAFGTRTLAITPLMKGILEVVHVFLRNNPPANAVDMFPELMQLPRFLQFWHRRAEAIGNRTYEVYAAYWKPVARAIHDGTAGPSFSRDVLQEEAGKFHGTEDQAMYLAAMLVEAGSDTTRAALNNLAMAMIAAPDFVKRVRAELESVCGYAERMPTFDDEEKLPLVAATIKELLRWRCIFPTTPPHRLTQDMEFEGYVFPKDTNFIINDRYISLNPEEHKYPQTFYPERWLNGKEHDVLSGLWAFGGGRKVCVGYRLAQRSLFINVAKIIYCFDFERAGPINEGFTFSNSTLGEPFPARPKIRSEKHAKLIEKAAIKLDVWEMAKGNVPKVEEEPISQNFKYVD